MKPILTLHDPATAAAYYAAGLWREQSCYRLMSDHAKERGAAFALRDRGRRLTWDQLKTAVDGFAATLAEGGLRRGDRLSIWASNRVEVVVAFLAASRNGYVCNPSLHVNYTTAEVSHLLDEIQATAFLYEPGHGADGDRVDAAATVADLDGLNQVIALEPGRQAMALPTTATGPAPVPSPDKVCYLAFTSGTTGKPKGVMHSDNTLLTNARALVADWHHDAATRLLSLSPLSHHIAWVGLAQALVAGAEFIINDLPPSANPLDWLLETGATYVMGVPTHAMDILDDQRRRGLDRLGAVRVFYMAGAPIPPATAEAFLAQGVMPQNIYGMTENSSHQYTLPNDDKDTIVTSCGRAGAGYEIKIFDREDADRPAAPGIVGQIGGRGAALMLGYFDNQPATESSFNHDGWFLSGDLGWLDDKGCLHIAGRLKDMIIRGGHNIYPTRIEDLAVSHPAIAKAAAFAVADDRLGEKVCLAILADGDTTPTGPEVLAHLNAVGLSKYDMPEYFLGLSAFPLTASGKILKRALAQSVADGELKPEPIRWRGDK